MGKFIFHRLVFAALSANFLIASPAYAAIYGINSYLSTRMNSGGMTTAAGLMAELGAGWTRQEFNYENIGGANGSNFGADDEAADKTLAQGVKILGLLNFSAETPPSSTDWESFVSNTVAHFASKVDAWEVLNEPNDSARPGRQMNGATYNDYLARSYGKIKEFDSSASVVSAGTASVDIGWLGELISAGGCNYADAFGIHPYRNDRPESVKFGEGDFANYIGTAAALIRRNCSSKKLWLTEFGIRSDVYGIDTQANYLAREYLLARTVSEVERVLSYTLKDDSTGGWGVLDSGFGKKSSFGRIQEVFTNVGAAGFSDELIVTDRRLVDGLGSTDGWGQQFNNNASATLSSVTGVSGSGLSVAYRFNASSSAVVLTKEMDISGTPSAIGFYGYGDNSRAIWRMRFTDANGETFQGLLGNGLSGWSWKQLELANTGAMTSWGGDGQVQYPIKFNSIVLDRDGGSSTGTIKVDTIAAVYGSADFKALKFGTTAVAWKASGSGSASVCGQSASLSETPSYFTVSSGCGSNSISGEGSSTPTTAPSETTTSEPTSAPTSTSQPTATPSASATTSVPASTQTFDPSKSLVTPTKWYGLADGVDAIELKFDAKDTSGQPMSVAAWEILGYRGTDKYTPPVDSSTSAKLIATEAGIIELTVNVIGGFTLPQKLYLVWTDPAWQSATPLDDLEDNRILSLKADDASETGQTWYGIISTELGLKIDLSGKSPVLVYATLASNPRTIPLGNLSDASFGGVMPLPDEIGEHTLSIVALDASGNKLAELTQKVMLSAEAETIYTVTGSIKKSFPWVWASLGIVALGIGVGVYLAWRRQNSKNKKHLSI